MTATDNARPVVQHVDEITVIDERLPEPVGTAGPRPRSVLLRHVDPWSVMKVSLVFYLCVCLVLLVAGLVLWTAAAVTGVVGNIESFFQDAGFEHFRFIPAQLFRGFLLGGLILVVAGSLATVLLAALFNLISDIVGGIRITLAEDTPEEPARR